MLFIDKTYLLTISTTLIFRVKWKILIGSIGQMERPFEITLLYSSCDEKNSGFLALGSLQLHNCLHGM